MASSVTFQYDALLSRVWLNPTALPASSVANAALDAAVLEGYCSFVAANAPSLGYSIAPGDVAKRLMLAVAAAKAKLDNASAPAPAPSAPTPLTAPELYTPEYLLGYALQEVKARYTTALQSNDKWVMGVALNPAYTTAASLQPLLDLLPSGSLWPTVQIAGADVLGAQEAYRYTAATGVLLIHPGVLVVGNPLYAANGFETAMLAGVGEAIATAATKAGLSVTTGPVGARLVEALSILERPRTTTTSSFAENTDIPATTGKKVADLTLAAGATATLGGPDATQFRISGTALYYIGSSPNYEVKQRYDVFVKIYSSASVLNLTSSILVTLTITDVNEAPTVSLSSTSLSLPEGTSIPAGGRELAVITVADDALGTNSLTPSGDDKDYFEIKEIAGKKYLYLKPTVLNYKAKASYIVRVQVDDATIGTRIDSWVDFTLTVTNVNEAPTTITLSNLSVAENAPGATVGFLSATDPDAGATFTFSVDDTRFEVVGNQLKLKAGMALDYEAAHSVSLTITATDQGGLSFRKLFPVDVINVNEAPTGIYVNSHRIPEKILGALIGIITVSDPDAGDTFTFTVDDKYHQFEIIGNQLKLKANKMVDGARVNGSVAEITATDRNGLSFTQLFSFTTNDNEAPTDIIIYNNFGIIENQPGATVGWLSATDPDYGDAFSYSVNDARFEIVGNQLKLKANIALDYEAASTIRLTITATDRDGLVFSKVITIVVINVDETINISQPPTNTEIPDVNYALSKIILPTVTDTDAVASPNALLNAIRTRVTAAFDVFGPMQNVLRPIRVAWRLYDRWYALGLPGLPNISNLRTALQSAAATAQDREDLNFVINNPAVFNAFDAGDDNGTDGLISRSDTDAFARAATADAIWALDWLQGRSKVKQLDAWRDQAVAVLLMNKRLIDTATGGRREGLGNKASLMKLGSALENPDLSPGLRAAARVFSNNSNMYLGLDTGGSPFAWQNDADGLFSWDDFTSWADTPFDLSGQLAAETLRRGGLTNVLTAQERLALLDSAPNLGIPNAFKDDAQLREQTEAMLDAALTPETLKWISEQIPATLDSWLAPGSFERQSLWNAAVVQLTGLTSAEAVFASVKDKYSNDRAKVQPVVAQILDILTLVGGTTLAVECKKFSDAVMYEFTFWAIHYNLATVEAAAGRALALRATMASIASEMGLDVNSANYSTIQEDITLALALLVKTGLSQAKGVEAIMKYVTDQNAKKQTPIPAFLTSDEMALVNRVYSKGYLHAAFGIFASGYAIAKACSGLTNDKEKAELASWILYSSGNLLEGAYRFYKEPISAARAEELDSIFLKERPADTDIPKEERIKLYQAAADAKATIFFKVLSSAGDGISAVLSALDAAKAFKSGDNQLGGIFVGQTIASSVSIISALGDVGVAFAAGTGSARATLAVLGTAFGVLGAIAALIGIMLLLAQMAIEIGRRDQLENDWLENAKRAFAGDARFDELLEQLGSRDDNASTS